MTTVQLCDSAYMEITLGSGSELREGSMAIGRAGRVSMKTTCGSLMVVSVLMVTQILYLFNFLDLFKFVVHLLNYSVIPKT